MDFKINGFLNISFGENKQSTIEKIKERNGILDLDNSTDDSLIFDNLKFAGRETIFSAFHFIDDEFCRAMVFLKANLESRTIELYQQIKEEITQKYYITNQDFENYQYHMKKMMDIQRLLYQWEKQFFQVFGDLKMIKLLKMTTFPLR
ncbi:hypothetical protein [Chryseobacterium scophthalmum]|uniref:Uncharacterized protein n=1 Tax=Chryseobacterium scophthalmum TaxID=59733 RepID=A0A1N6E9M5_9FLAO|nr:hypothetical protein [Chryseobacterium scophthalmum]SIN79724.1 hypothetical protein SAMN05421769_0051 [Chryseobacterium scophthalmum]